MKSVFFGLMALASAVIAQGDYFQIRSPRKGTVLTPGEVSTIRWTEGLKGKVLVNILKGNDPHVMVPTGMAFMTLGEQNLQRWRVPTNLDPSDTYALEFNFKLPNGEITQSFSDQFKVAAASPMTEAKVVDSTPSMTNSQTPDKLSSFFEESNSAMVDTSMSQRQRQAPASSTMGQQKMTSTGTQGTMRKPSRGKMRIIIQYPSEEEEGMSTGNMNAGTMNSGSMNAQVKATGGQMTESMDTMSPQFESVLDAAAAEAAAAKNTVGTASTRAKVSANARTASNVRSANNASPASAARGASSANRAGVVKAASNNKSKQVTVN